MQGPAWDFGFLYSSIRSPEYLKDFEQVQIQLAEFCKQSEAFSKLTSTNSAIALYRSYKSLAFELAAIAGYTNAIASIESTDSFVKEKYQQIQSLSAQMEEHFSVLKSYLIRMEDVEFAKLLGQENAFKEDEFALSELRKLKSIQLSDAEEQLLKSLEMAGHQAWGNLYFDLGSSFKVPVELPAGLKICGLSEAAAYVKGGDLPTRKAAWTAIENVWHEHRETAAAVVNALADWRIKLAKKRSHTKEQSFLSEPCRDNRIQPGTLDAMMQALYDNRSKAQSSVQWIAKNHGEEKLSPWNHLASSPFVASDEKIPFAQALQWIEDSFSRLSPELGQFVRMMSDKKLLEGRVMASKSGGGYCDRLLKPKLPIVFQTYMGSLNDVLTLAHELGHAFHYWVLRDYPMSQQSYPMTLAETASVFGETVLLNDLVKMSKSKNERLSFLWGEVERNNAFTLNIPVRFDFEKSFYEARQSRVVQSDELCSLYDQAWRKWYGDTLSETDKYYWAHKLHFHIAGSSFYNFPYSFGYLFSLSIYARRAEWGQDFFKKYQQLLIDTGRMSCEDLVKKHFDEDISQSQFWSKTLRFINAGLVEKMKLV